MLNEVPAAIMRAARQVTLRHPNAIECTVWRKQVDRTADSDVGGMPNIGAMGVLDSEDEAAYSYEPVGDAKIVFEGIYSDAAANWMDSESGLNYTGEPVLALIEFKADALAKETHPQKQDIVSVEPGGGHVLQYEILGEAGTVKIPPYTRRYILGAVSNSDTGIT